MSMVRFAYVCDLCGKRQEEYGSCPTCTECGRDICFSCLHGVTREAEGEWIGDPPTLHGNRDEGICKKCYIEELDRTGHYPVTVGYCRICGHHGEDSEEMTADKLRTD